MKYKKIIFVLLILVLGFGVTVSAAPVYLRLRSILPETDNTYDLGSTTARWANIYGTTFIGDGSQLTGVTGGSASTSINGAVGPFTFSTTTGSSYFRIYF